MSETARRAAQILLERRMSIFPIRAYFGITLAPHEYFDQTPFDCGPDFGVERAVLCRENIELIAGLLEQVVS
jgi:hypothetical protein